MSRSPFRYPCTIIPGDTNILPSVLLLFLVNFDIQEEFYGKELILADRETVEQEADSILKEADVCDVAFLVVGDPFG